MTISELRAAFLQTLLQTEWRERTPGRPGTARPGAAFTDQ